MNRKIVIVSGGSRGLGLEMVETLLSKGYKVVTFARKKTLEVEKLMKIHSSQFYFKEMDSRDQVALRDLFKEIKIHLEGEIYGLVNNAAIGQDHLLTQISSDKIHEIISVNIEAPILLTKAFVKSVLLSGQPARIVNISSICGQRGFQGLTVYSATKAAMDGFTRSLAREFGERNIYVNSVAPGFFESEMSSVLAPNQLETIKRRTPTGRLVKAEEIFPLVTYLLSEEINITGQVFSIDGGSSL